MAWPRCLDFGLARRVTSEELMEGRTLTQDTLVMPGQVAGTLAYMAPEQLRGQPADERSDVWALGVVLHEMAAGERPFKGDTAFELSSSILNQPPAPLPTTMKGAPPALLRSVIERCLEKDPSQRYQKAGEVRAALEAVQAGAGLPVWPRLKRAVSRHRVLAAAGALAIVVAVAAAVDVGGLRSRLLAGAVGARVPLPGGPSGRQPLRRPRAGVLRRRDDRHLIADVSKIGALRVIPGRR
jgi:eukaryotic-like serine/threonine-protein kinase